MITNVLTSLMIIFFCTFSITWCYNYLYKSGVHCSIIFQLQMFHILYDAQRVPLVTSQISFLINPLHPIPRPRPHHTFTLKANSITCVITSLTAEWYVVRQEVALVKQGSALLALGWVTARLISRWHSSGLVAVASNACEVTLWINFHGYWARFKRDIIVDSAGSTEVGMRLFNYMK